MKTEIGFQRNKNEKLEKIIVDHEFNATTSAGKGEIQRALLSNGIGNSMVRFQRPYSATREQLASLASFFKPAQLRAWQTKTILLI